MRQFQWSCLYVEGTSEFVVSLEEVNRLLLLQGPWTGHYLTEGDVMGHWFDRYMETGMLRLQSQLQPSFTACVVL